MRTIAVLLCVVLAASVVLADATLVKAKDYWVNAANGTILTGAPAPAAGQAPPAQAIATAVTTSGGCCGAVKIAVALRQVVLVKNGSVVRVLRTYYVGVPLSPDGRVPAAVSDCGNVYIPWRKVSRCVKWDVAGGAWTRCWLLR